MNKAAIKFVSEDEAETCDIVVCRLVTNMPIPEVPSEIEHCLKCKGRIWVADTTPAKPARFCAECAADLVKFVEAAKDAIESTEDAIAMFTGAKQ